MTSQKQDVLSEGALNMLRERAQMLQQSSKDSDARQLAYAVECLVDMVAELNARMGAAAQALDMDARGNRR